MRVFSKNIDETNPYNYESRWNIKGFRCKLTLDKTGITIVMRGGATSPGYPGEEFIFFRDELGTTKALEFIEQLPHEFGPERCTKLGFKQTRYAIFN